MEFEIENGVLKKYKEKRGVTDVVIPDSVTSIGGWAFSECSRRTSVVIAGKDIFLPADRKNVHINDITNLIFQKDYDIKKGYAMKMDHDVKYAVIAGLFRAGYDEEGVFAYIKKNFAKFFAYLLKTGDAEAVQRICDNSKLLIKSNIDKYLQVAIDAGQTEIFVMLLDYKNRVTGYSDPTKQFKL